MTPPGDKSESSMDPEYPFDSKYLDLEGLRYHFVDEGDGEPLLMVHGNPTWSFMYRNLIKDLSPDYRTIAPDHIGCGRSDKPADDEYEYTLESRVRDLDRLVEHLGLARLTLVVHDWGGMIGTTWAVRNPDRVARMIVFNTSAFHLPPAKKMPFSLSLARTPVLGPILIRGLSAFSRGANRYNVVRGPMSRSVARGFHAPYDSWSNRRAVLRFIQDIPLKPVDRAWDLVSDTQDKLHLLRDVPMMFCWGMQDFVFDHHFLEEWIRHFPRAEVHRFVDAGHYVLEDAGQEIYPLVRTFLSTNRVPVEA